MALEACALEPQIRCWNGLNGYVSLVDHHEMSVPTRWCRRLLTSGLDEGQARDCPQEQAWNPPKIAGTAYPVVAPVSSLDSSIIALQKFRRAASGGRKIPAFAVLDLSEN